MLRLIPKIRAMLERQGPGSPEATLKALSFILPENCWTEYFYAPQVNAQKAFLEKNADNQFAIDFIASQRHETELYYKYDDLPSFVPFFRNLVLKIQRQSNTKNVIVY